MAITQKYISLNTYAYGCPCIHNGYLIVDSLTAMTAYRWDGTSIQYIASVIEDSINNYIQVYYSNVTIRSNRSIFSNGTYIFRGCASGAIKVYTFNGSSFTHIATSSYGSDNAAAIFGVDFTTNPITIFRIGVGPMNYTYYVRTTWYTLEAFNGSSFSTLGTANMPLAPVYMYQWEYGCLSAKNGVYHGIIASASTTPYLRKVSLTNFTGTTPDYQATSPCMDIISKNDKTFFSGTPVDTLLTPGIYGDYSITDYKNCTLDYDGSYIYAAGSKNNGQLVVAVLKPGNPMTVVGEMALPSEITAQSPLWGKGRIWVAGNNRVVYVLGLGSTPGTPLNSPQVLSVYEASEITADFYGTPAAGPTPLNVQFTYSGDILPDSVYDWDFGDGSHSTLQNPSHEYTDIGLYDVSITVDSPSEGIGSKTITEYINVFEPPPIVNFSSSVTESEYPLVAQFTDTSGYAYPISSWYWDFGDGASSNEQNPIHTYNTPGNYTVSLTITNSYSYQGIETKNNYINVKDIDYTIDFVGTPLSGESPLSVKFTNLSSVPEGRSILSWEWDFGDGSISIEKDPTHTFLDKGIYTVTLKAKISI